MMSGPLRWMKDSNTCRSGEGRFHIDVIRPNVKMLSAIEEKNIMERSLFVNFEVERSDDLPIFSLPAELQSALEDNNTISQIKHSTSHHQKNTEKVKVKVSMYGFGIIVILVRGRRRSVGGRSRRVEVSVECRVSMLK
jgi:hypothetical protein